MDLAKMGRAVGGYQVCVDAMRLLEVSERPHTVISELLIDRTVLQHCGRATDDRGYRMIQ